MTTKVVFIASEGVPFAKTGGLADVVGALPRELRRQGFDVRVILPKYQAMPESLRPLLKKKTHFTVNIGWREQYCGVEEAHYEGVPFYFIDNEYYFGRDGYYGFDDEAERFTFFAKAALTALPHTGCCPDVLHLHDWQTGLISLLRQAHFGWDPFYQGIRTVFTIHNLMYQGVFPKSILGDLLQLDSEHFRPDGVEFYGGVSFLKAGIVYSDRLTTVSPTYAQEIQDPFYGEKLDGLLRGRSQDLVGIINGIDYEEYNPQADPLITTPFSGQSLRYKADNKRKLQQELGLTVDPKIPMIAFISRLVRQKGLDLIERVLDEVLAEGVQFVVLGIGDEMYQDMLQARADRWPEQVSANIRFDNGLAHRMYAASDLFLMPSLFEPCGLAQLIAMRYGCLPVVRETGGLKDTVRPYAEETDEGWGFSFTNYNAHDMLYTIRRALSLYQNKAVWTKIRRRAMAQDFSWQQSAVRYAQLYRSLLGS